MNVSVHDKICLALTGPNGSGKSTFLQILAGYLTPSEGTVLLNHQPWTRSSCFELIHYSAPYIQLPEEMTFSEFLDFHAYFRKRIKEKEDIAELTQLPLNQSIVAFSTGMKQRIQLSTAFYFKNNIAFMDEPTANLDDDGFEWWKKEVSQLKIPTIIASNQVREIQACNAKHPLSPPPISI